MPRSNRRARTPSASVPTNLGRGGKEAQSRSPPSFGFDPIEGLATGSVSWLDAQPPFDPGNGGESQGFRVFGSNAPTRLHGYNGSRLTQGLPLEPIPMAAYLEE